MSTLLPAEEMVAPRGTRRSSLLSLRRYSNACVWSRVRRFKTDALASVYSKFRRCVTALKKAIADDHVMRQERARRKSHAKLMPPPDRPIRKVVVNSKIARRPTNELERLRKKGEDWTANDLFRFQYSNPARGDPDETRALCYEWLNRLLGIPKKYCYLAWYASAIYACYYRLVPLVKESEEKKRIWEEVKREYAEIFCMGRRIWRRPSHPSRLHVFYDFAMLCVQFGRVERHERERHECALGDDPTVKMFRDELQDAGNFDFSLLDEVKFAQSVDKVVRLENHVIDQFFSRRRSTCSSRSSFRSRRSTMTDHSPSRKTDASDRSDKEDEAKEKEKNELSSAAVITEAIERLSLVAQKAHTSIQRTGSRRTKKNSFSGPVPTIVIDTPYALAARALTPSSAPASRPPSRKSSLISPTSRPNSPRPNVRFASDEKNVPSTSLDVEKEEMV